MNTPTPYWYPLFEHLSREHGLTLTDSQLHEITLAADRCHIRKETMTTDNDQAHRSAPGVTVERKGNDGTTNND